MSDAAASTLALQRSVDACYATFSHYVVGSIAFCAACHTGTGRVVAALNDEDRRAIGATHVAEFFENVGSSVFANEATFKALLPRVLELAEPGADEIAHLNVATLGIKLAEAGARTWPKRERDAVDAWARAWFEATLACGDPHGTALDDVLCALGELYDGLAPFLSRLRDATAVRERTQIAHLALTVAFALSYARSDLRDDWSPIGAHWRKGSRSERQMLAWLAMHATSSDLLADATRDGCACGWVAMIEADELDRIRATFAVALAETTISASYLA